MLLFNQGYSATTESSDVAFCFAVTLQDGYHITILCEK